MDAGKPRLVGVEVELDLRRFGGDAGRSQGRPRTAGHRGGPGHRAPGVLFRGFRTLGVSVERFSPFLVPRGDLDDTAGWGPWPSPPRAGGGAGGRGRVARGGLGPRTPRRRVRAKNGRSQRFQALRFRGFLSASSEGPGRAYEKVVRSNEGSGGARRRFNFDAGVALVLSVCVGGRGTEECARQTELPLADPSADRLPMPSAMAPTRPRREAYR